MTHAGRLVLWVLAAVGAPAPVAAQLAGHVGVELRAFPEQALHDGQVDYNASVELQPRADFRLGERWQLSVELFARADTVETDRSHADLREAAVSGTLGPWDVYAGVGQVFWGVTESRHLVDVINQTDLEGDIDEEDKLGQPMMSVSRGFAWGRLTATGLFGFRTRTFPGTEGRLRAPLPVSDDAILPDGRAFDFAVRWSHFVGSWDLAATYFNGVGREPVLVPSDGGAALVPVYGGVRRWGVEIQHTQGDWLWKAEGLVADPDQGDAWAASVVGFEVTVPGALGAADLGILAELHLDSRGRRAPTPFQRDVFVGWRLGLNDVASTAVLSGAVVDPESGATFWLVEAERRVAKRWTAELWGRAFAWTDEGDPLHELRRDDHLALTIRFHF